MSRVYKTIISDPMYSKGYKYYVLWDDNSKSYYETKDIAYKEKRYDELGIDLYKLSDMEIRTKQFGLGNNGMPIKYVVFYAQGTKSEAFTNVKDAELFINKLIK